MLRLTLIMDTTTAQAIHTLTIGGGRQMADLRLRMTAVADDQCDPRIRSPHRTEIET